MDSASTFVYQVVGLLREVKQKKYGQLSIYRPLDRVLFTVIHYLYCEIS